MIVGACGSERSCPPATARTGTETQAEKLRPASGVRKTDDRRPAAPTDEPIAPSEPAVGPCPLRLREAAVRVEPLESGAALVFTTTADVVELRQKVERTRKTLIAEGAARAAHSRADHVERGIRLVFVASSAADADRLRQELERYAARLAKSCALTVGEAAREEGARAQPSAPRAQTSPAQAASEPPAAEPPKPEAKPAPDAQAKDEPAKDAPAKAPAKDAGSTPDDDIQFDDEPIVLPE